MKWVCKRLLETLKREKLVLDWRNKPQSRGEVRLTIEKLLDEGLPDRYDETLYRSKCDGAYRYVFDSYQSHSPHPPLEPLAR